MTSYIDILKHKQIAKKEEVLLWLFRYINENCSGPVAKYMFTEDRTVFNQKADRILLGVTEIIGKHLKEPLTKVIEEREELTIKNDDEQEKWEASIIQSENCSTFRYFKMRGLSRVLDHILNINPALISVNVKPTTKQINSPGV